MRWIKKWLRHSAQPNRPLRAQLWLEALETRVVPYATTGNAWVHPNLVTISFMPDGTNLGGVTTNMFATFNSDFGSTAAWENVILQAAQTWAQQTKVNFAVVSDNGASEGAGNYQQGDPNFGDIRIGGFNYGTSDLATTFLPPPINNYSIAGDMTFNTGQGLNINGSDYDLYTVALHEFGHTLGLSHSSDQSAVMFPIYMGLVTGLATDDINGVQAIYGAPSTDGTNVSFSTASDITSKIDTSKLTALVTGQDITTTSDVDYYKFTAPTGTNGNLTVKVQSAGLSLLTPSLKIYNSSQTLLGSVNGTGYAGSTLSKTVSVTAGQVYYVRVTGANSTANGIGAYAITLNFGPNASPTVPLPNTQTANGSPISAGGGLPQVTSPGQETDGRDVLGGTADSHRAAAPTSGAGAVQATSSMVQVAPHTLLATSSGAQVAGGSASAVAAPATLPAQTDHAMPDTHVESGGGSNRMVEDNQDDTDALPLWDDPGPAMNGEVAIRAEALIPAMSQQADVWRAASTDYFTGTAERNTSPVDIEATLENTAPAASVQDPAAAALGFTLVLGGYWARQREEKPTRKGLRLKR